MWRYMNSKDCPGWFNGVLFVTWCLLAIHRWNLPPSHEGMALFAFFVWAADRNLGEWLEKFPDGHRASESPHSETGEWRF